VAKLTRFEASIKRGTADPCPPGLIPAELRQARALWEAQGAEANEAILALLSNLVRANFVPSNIPVLNELMTLDENEDVEAEEVRVIDFHFRDDGLPSVSAYASYMLPLHRTMTQEQIEEWEEEQSEYLTDCVNFFWTFEDPAGHWSHVIGDHQGAGMGLAD
jgi:hypothetical protein